MLGLRSRSAAVAAAVLAVSLTGATTALTATPSYAAGERPVAYVNPDTGKDTENPGVSSASECEAPVQADTMALGDEADGTGNVHVDACLFSGSERVDVKAAFEVSGVGVVSACPDADKDGPKTATKTASSCLQDGFEEANSEYHVRVVSATAGLQTVRFCADPEGNGCGDAEAVSTVRITWGAPQGGVAAGGGLPGGLPGGSPAVALLALTAAGIAVAAGRLSRASG